jgi:hypothetical protein
VCEVRVGQRGYRWPYEAAYAGTIGLLANMATESHVDPLTVYAAHSFKNDRSYQVSRFQAFISSLKLTQAA